MADKALHTILAHSVVVVHPDGTQTSLGICSLQSLDQQVRLALLNYEKRKRDEAEMYVQIDKLKWKSQP